MDYAYWDAPRNRLVLLEVKDYTDREAPRHLLHSLIGKGRDSLVMLQSVWRGSGAGVGAALRREIPERLRLPSRLQLVFVLKADERTRMGPINEMRDQLVSSLRSYMDLLELTGHSTLMNQDKASKIGLPLRASSTG